MTMLKLQDKPALEFDVDNGDFFVIDNQILPFTMRDNMIDSRQDDSRRAFIHDYRCLMDYLHNRSLSIHRSNAKIILNSLHIPQSDDDSTVTKMMIMCKALSVSDDYWITNSPSEKWADVNVRDNPLHEVLSQLSLCGKSPLTITGHIRTPELTGQGSYAKAWFRENKELFLYKASTDGNLESEIEAEVSNILDYTNVPHVKYKFVEKEERRCCRCKNMSSSEKSMASAIEVMKWCNHTDRNFDKFVLKQDSENFYKTLIADYLISNADRHIENWGFFMNNTTGKLLKMHPLLTTIMLFTVMSWNIAIPLNP